MENQLLIALSRNKLLKNVNISKIDLQNVRGKLITISEGEILYREGDSADIIFLVVSGEINVLKKRLLGKTKSYLFLENDFFGHEEFFEETSRTSTAVALKDSYLISLIRDEIDILINQDDEILVNLREPIAEIDEAVLSRKEENKTDAPKEEVDDFKTPSSLEDKFQSFDKYVETEESKSPDIFQSISDFSNSSNEGLKEVTETKLDFEEPMFPQDFPTTEPSKEESEFVQAKEIENTTPETPFDESVFLNEDGIPKAEFEMPNLAPSAEKKTDEDLTDALFKILGSGDNQQFTPPKPTEPNSSSEIDEAFFDSLNFGETLQKNLEPPNEKIPQIIEEKKIEPEYEEPKIEVGKSAELKVLPIEDKISEIIPGLVVQEPEDQVVESEKIQQGKVEISKLLAHEKEKINADELMTRFKIADLVSSNTHVDEVLNNIVNVAMDLTNADRGTLYLINKEKNELWSIITHGDETRKIFLPVGESIAGSVLKSGETINIKDVEKDPRFKKDLGTIGEYVTKNIICFPVKNNNGEIIGVLQLLNNKNGEFLESDEKLLSVLSVYAAIGIQNAEMIERLLQSERDQSFKKMANFLIQEIKKPTLVAKRYAEYFKEKQVTGDTLQVIDLLLEQLTQVADIVQTTSIYSESKNILRTANVSLNGTLLDYSSRCERYTDSRLCEIVNEFDNNVTVKIDVKEFYQCYFNIVKNACDAMPNGGKIYVSTKQLDKKIEIRFRDTGLGIPEIFIEKIFEPFFSRDKKEGTGLGLSITKKIIETLNGTITVQSFISEGTTFIISLPISSVF